MGYPELRLYAEIYDDALEFRKASLSKIRSGTVLDDAGRFSDTVAMFSEVEHQMSLAIKQEMRKSIGSTVLAWQKSEPGIGKHLLARLIGILGDPYVATPYRWQGTGAGRVQVADPPYTRTVSQLWAYCGYGDPDRNMHKGISSEELAALGNPKAKMLVHLLAEACVKAGVRSDKTGETEQRTSRSRYGQVYLDDRKSYADATHRHDCARCGPRGKPALAGSPLSKAHQHAASLRKVGKEILRNLWEAAREDAKATA